MKRLLTIVLCLSVLRMLAQVGTWHNYLAYHDVQDIQKAGNKYLFVLASNALYQYNLNDQSITTYDKTNGLSDTHITHIAWSQQAQRLIAVYEDSNIDLVETDGTVINMPALYMKSTTEDKTVSDLRIDGIHAYLITGLGILKVNLQRAEISETYTPGHPDYPSVLPEKSRADYEQYLATVESLNPGGPKYNYFYESRFSNGSLYTTGGYFLSGMPDPHRPGIVQCYNAGDWQVYEEEISAKTGYDYIDLCCIDVDPRDPQHVFAGGRTGLYEFQDGKLINHFNEDNSPLQAAIDRGRKLDNRYVLITGVKFDADANLWVLNSQAQGVSLLEYSNTGEWSSHHFSQLVNENDITFQALRNMMLDSHGMLWFVNDNWFAPAVFCYDPWTDGINRYDNFTNQDGTKYNINWVYAVAEDHDGNIWVGTDSGPFMIRKQEIGQGSGATFYQVKVPRNDGTDYADYLLAGVSISSIAIDGGNRKWFGTNGAGVFLISSDNMEQIHNFTTDNSQLISNDIASININNQTGEVFFLSDQGLCSYLSDATQPADEMSEDNVYAYPNPVTPDYNGLITVVGLSYNADIKITSASGALIAEGRSNGGLFTWDGKDKNGKRVASGIYMVIAATSDGKKGTVCKIAIIR